ncbi:MAG: cation:proton antiporter [Spirochaetales bacterium]|nr:cation:proton antiporter [Spirochaetales bacterium]
MENVLVEISIIIIFSAVLSWFAFFLKQPIIIAYIGCGILFGPWGLSFIKGINFIESISHIGITLLLFLAGLVLHPKRLLNLFRETLIVTTISSMVFFAVPFLFTYLWGFTFWESIVCGIALMFSSTIIVVKLLPTTTLHQQHMGSICIAVLLAQDLLAITAIMLVNMNTTFFTSLIDIAIIPVKGIVLVIFAFLFEEVVIRRIMRQIDKFHELLYLSAFGWCFGLAILSQKLGFTFEVGAFIAGLSLARNPLSLFLSENLKNFRDFFLVFFFFVLGATIDLSLILEILLPAVLLGIIILIIKPLIFKLLFLFNKEQKKFSNETSLRLGQSSEFSLILVILAYKLNIIGRDVSFIIQLTTIISMIVSSYIVILKYPTPLGIKENLKKD